MEQIRRCQPWLGTYVDISLQGSASVVSLQSMANQAFLAIRQVHEAMSFHLPDSELSRVNREAIARPVPIGAALHEVLKTALDISRRSDGAFDVSVAGTLMRQGVLPRQAVCTERRASWRDIELTHHHVRFHRPLLVDLGGIAKGFAVDRACAVLPDDIRFGVNAGGDLRLSHWHSESAQVRLPGRGELTRTVLMRNAALASSADLGRDRYSVVVGPHRRRLRRHALSLSVFADNAMLADALTKVLRVHPDPVSILAELNAEGYRLDAGGHWQPIGAMAPKRAICV